MIYHKKHSKYDIYIDNIDRDSNKLMPISEVCVLNKYKIYQHKT